MCESDSLEAVDLISKVDTSLHLYAPVINDIHHLLHKDWQVEVKHIL